MQAPGGNKKVCGRACKRARALAFGVAMLNIRGYVYRRERDTIGRYVCVWCGYAEHQGYVYRRERDSGVRL